MSTLIKTISKKGKGHSYGYCYDHKGDHREVSYPVNEKLQLIKKHTKTLTGKIPDSVGFPGFKS